jgi:hypothetical protein
MMSINTLVESSAEPPLKSCHPPLDAPSILLERRGRASLSSFLRRDRGENMIDSY